MSVIFTRIFTEHAVVTTMKPFAPKITMKMCSSIYLQTTYLEQYLFLDYGLFGFAIFLYCIFNMLIPISIFPLHNRSCYC